MLRRSRHLSTIGVFPLHLDPPNLDHHRVFREILNDPTLQLTKLVLLPLSHSSVSLQKSLHLTAMAALSLRDFEQPQQTLMPAGGVTGSSSPSASASIASQLQHGALIFAAAEEEQLEETKNSFLSTVGVDTVAEDPNSKSSDKRKHVRVEVNFTALEMHEDKISVLESICQQCMNEEMEKLHKLKHGSGSDENERYTQYSAQQNASSSASSSSAGKASRKKEHHHDDAPPVTLFQWLADVEIGGCLADRLWPRINKYIPNMPMTILIPTGPAYPAVGDPITESIVSRAAGRWQGHVSVLNVRREWSSGYVRRRLLEEEGKCNKLVSGPILRYIDSHNLYRDERRHRQRYVAAVAENATRLPLVDWGYLQQGGHQQQFVIPPSSMGSSSSDSYFFEQQQQQQMQTVMFPSSESAAAKANTPSSKWVSYAGAIPKLELHYDPRNSLARHIFEQLKAFQVRPGEDPDLIVPIGGDGYLMKCVRRFWSRFIPFFGVNAGHVGFLLNDAGLLEEFFCAPLRLYQVSMLYCVADHLMPELLEGDPLFGGGGGGGADGGDSKNDNKASPQHPSSRRSGANKPPHQKHSSHVRAFAFNDAWMERATGQTAKFRICVNGVERSRSVRGDGVLVSTAAGSTAYAQALGGSPMPIDTPILQLVGSNCTWPVRWRPVHLPEDVMIDLESCDTDKRPCRAYVDSVDLGLCRRLRVRASRVAGVQLAFTRSSDVQAKLYKMQFPDQ